MHKKQKTLKKKIIFLVYIQLFENPQNVVQKHHVLVQQHDVSKLTKQPLPSRLTIVN